MANSYGSNFWRLDTEGAIVDFRLTIKKIIFKPSDSGDEVVLSDSQGKIFWEFTNALAATPIGDKEVDWPNNQEIDGITITTLSSGAVLFIYFQK